MRDSFDIHNNLSGEIHLLIPIETDCSNYYIFNYSFGLI